MICCPHPAAEHAADVTVSCVVLHCGCEQLINLTRCQCPYRDCWLMVDTASGLCPTCEQVCVPAHSMENLGIAR